MKWLQKHKSDTILLHTQNNVEAIQLYRRGNFVMQRTHSR